MASHDVGWDAFREELRHWMELRGVTSRALATQLEQILPPGIADRLDEHIVKRWRHSTSPPLGAVRHIAAVLEMSDDPTGHAPHDPAFILRRMGLLDAAAPSPELLDSSFRLQELRLRLLDVRASLGRHTARTGAGQLVQSAMSLGFAAAVYPVWDGPAGYPMHVADRIDFRPATPSAGQIDDSVEMRSSLIENFAVPGQRTPRFSRSEKDLADQEHWAIPLIGRPFTHAGNALHFDVPAVAVSSSTPSSWPDDVGAMLAWVLGYGFVSTREIARELTSKPLATEGLRNDVHQQFVHQAPERHVWSHHATTLADAHEHAPWADESGAASPRLFHVHLLEDDALLEWSGDWMAGSLGCAREEAVRTAKANRDEAQRRLASLPPDVRSRILVVPVGRREGSAERWEQSMQAVLATTRALHERGLTVDLTPIHERLVRDEPDIGGTLLRWMADHHSPLVSAKFATSPA